MAVTGLNLVAQAIQDVLPAPLYIGDFPSSEPERAIALQDVGGTDSVRVIGTAVPRYIVDRVNVQVRDRNYDSEHGNPWARSVVSILRNTIIQLRGVPSVSEVREQIPITPRQAMIEVDSTYPEVWGRQLTGPRQRVPRKQRSAVIWEAQFEIKYRPSRVRPRVTPLFFYLAESNISRTEVTHQLASNIVVPESGVPGRTWVGGEVTFGLIQPTTIGPDVPFPAGAQQGVLGGGEARLRWRNTNVVTGRAPGGRWEIFDTSSNNRIPIDADSQVTTRFDSAEVTPNGLELKFNQRFSSEFERTGAFFLQQADRPATPEIYVFELFASTPPEDRGGEFVYTFTNFNYLVGGSEVWNWGFGLTTEFLGSEVPTVPPNNPSFSAVWRADWDDGLNIVRDNFDVPRLPDPENFDNNLRRIQLPVTLSQRVEGGTIQQSLALIDQTPGFTRLQTYKVSIEFSGKVVHGERDVTAVAPEAPRRQAFSPGFDEGFE